MNIKDISTALGVAPNTIRNWLSVYQEFLSPGAHPLPGKRRVLSSHDLQVLALITTLKRRTRIRAPF
jgi:transposase-like protein